MLRRYDAKLRRDRRAFWHASCYIPVMRHLLLVLCLAAAGCAGQVVPIEGQSVAQDEGPSMLGIVAEGACFAGIVAAGVVLMNPGAIGGVGLCTGN